MSSCKGNTQNADYQTEKLETDFMSWWKYYNKNVDLSLDFVALNQNDKKISKETFLNELGTGKYIPIKMNNKTEQISYKLYKTKKQLQEDIYKTLKQQSYEYLSRYKRENTNIPEFEFTSLDGIYLYK